MVTKAKRERAPSSTPLRSKTVNMFDITGKHQNTLEAVVPIVGIGASAGGLEALRELLEALPVDTGMGFVFVQHLDPDHESHLVEILSRSTSLPVKEIVNGEQVKANHVYVIPPDTSLTLDGEILKLKQRERSRVSTRPIDVFLESLAQHCREKAVGVVLSGTASDGALGLEAIKAEGGITFAQDDSAKYDSMPKSAVAAGCVDLVLSPAEIAREIARIAKHPYLLAQRLVVTPKNQNEGEDERAVATAHADDDRPLRSGGKGRHTDAKLARIDVKRTHGRADDLSNTVREEHEGYKKILLFLRNHSGVDFSLYKNTTIQRRIKRRVVLSKQSTLDAYANFLRGNPKELDTLYSDVLISVTSFFRNAETFEFLQQKVLPELLKQRSEEPVRCWVLGCSTGQEAYSIAMAFAELAEKASRVRRVQIFATDLNDLLLEKARQGLYAKNLVEDISPQRLQSFFVEEDGGYRVSKSLREMVVFARQNLTADPPFSHVDLISCRNLLIYLEQSLQRKALPTFHYALKPGGFLLLGASESIGGFTELFEPVDKKHKIYAKKAAMTPSLHLPAKKERDMESPGARNPLSMPSSERAEGLRRENDAQREADRITVNQFAPPGVLVSTDLQVLQFRGPTDAFLEPPVGKASFDVLKMAREGLMLPLRAVINQAKKTNKAARKENVRIKRNGKVRRVNLEVIPLTNLRERCFLILFEEANAARTLREPAPPKVSKRQLNRREEPSRIAELEAELTEMRGYIQSMQEQHEAAQEEVQSAHEEVQSTNEELQSINEELETSKEELESANEELTTVNEEMSTRNDELNRLNNDLVNLQTSAKLAVVLFGRDLTIRRFSPHAEKQFDLLVADVGRPIGHIRHGLVEVEPSFQSTPDPITGIFTQRETPLDLERLVSEVISDVREQEREVRDRTGRWHSLRVRPYMTRDSKVDGAVLVLVDVDQLKRSEQASSRLAAIVESSVDAILSKTLGGVITSWNSGAERLFGYSAEYAIGRNISLIVPPDRQEEEEEVRARLKRGEKVPSFETERQNKNGRRISVSLTISPIRDAAGQIISVSTAARDITERRQSELALRESEERYRELVEQVKDYAIFSVDLQGRATTWNEGVKRVLGFDRDEFIGHDIQNSIFTPEDVEAGVPQRELNEAAKNGSSSNDRWMRRKDGTRFFANGMTTALKERGGEISGFAKVMRDQTQKVRAEEALRRSEEQLRKYSAELSEAAARKNEFLAMLGHELRNPLSALSNGLELLVRIPDDNEKRRGLGEMMTRQAVRMRKLLEQLLDISRVISGKLDLSQEPVDLSKVIDSAIETVRPTMEAQKHRLTVTLPAENRVAVVKGDEVRLTQVVENLLVNSAKYTNEGGHIEVKLENEGDHVRIAVKDNGIGISTELLPYVFEVFTQAPRALDRAKGGLGLGLPLAERLVEMHGGKITATSGGLGEGSEFVVVLPRFIDRRAQERHRRDEGGQTSDRAEQKNLRILLVDDEDDARRALKELLEETGHTVIAVRNGPAALEAARTSVPDVVLLDLGLPEMNGYEVAKKLREEHSEKKMFLVAVTGYASDAPRLKDAGFDRHLIKPAQLKSVMEVLTESASNSRG